MLHADWSLRLRENRPDKSSQPIKHLAVMLTGTLFSNHGNWPILSETIDDINKDEFKEIKLNQDAAKDLCAQNVLVG